MKLKQGIVVVVVALSLSLTGFDVLADDQMVKTPDKHKLETYQNTMEEIEEYRLKQKIAFDNADSLQQGQIISQCQAYLLSRFTEDIFPAWYGTEWDFNGAADIPNDGEIACGYFISTTLKHVGFRLNRYKLAQQGAHDIIKNLVDQSKIQNASSWGWEKFEESISADGPGLYVVGLDCHVGFVLCLDGNVTFVHSSYYNPPHCVVSEPAKGCNPLYDSSCRILGKLFEDDLVRKWIIGERVSVIHLTR